MCVCAHTHARRCRRVFKCLRARIHAGVNMHNFACKCMVLKAMCAAWIAVGGRRQPTCSLPLKTRLGGASFLGISHPSGLLHTLGRGQTCKEQHVQNRTACDVTTKPVKVLEEPARQTKPRPRPSLPRATEAEPAMLPAHQRRERICACPGRTGTEVTLQAKKMRICSCWGKLGALEPTHAKAEPPGRMRSRPQSCRPGRR